MRITYPLRVADGHITRHARPAGFGDVWLSAGYDPDGVLERLEVIRADPRVLVSGQFLREVAAGVAHLHATRASISRVEAGGVLRIGADNQVLVYVLTEFEPDVGGYRVPGAWAAEWPD